MNFFVLYLNQEGEDKKMTIKCIIDLALYKTIIINPTVKRCQVTVSNKKGLLERTVTTDGAAAS